MVTYVTHGSSSALVTERFMLLIDIPGDEATQLWELVADPDTKFETVLTELMRGGISNLRDFALLEMVDPAGCSATIAVRGRGKIHIGDTELHGQGLSTWVEDTAQFVTSARLSLGETPSGAMSLPIERGLVQTSELVWGNETPDHFSETVAVQAGILQPPPPALTREIKESVDERTIVRRAVPKWMLRFTSGKVIGIGERVVVGRRPTPTASAGEQLAPLLAPRREVSSNHALLIAQEEGVELVDLDSTNGTLVHTQNDESFTIRDGASYVLDEGDTIDFGDGNVAECVRASHPRV